MTRRAILSWAMGLVLSIGLGAGAWRYYRSHRPPLVTYQTAPVARRRVVGRVTATGTLLATVTVQVGTQVSGNVQRLLVDYNSPVKKGQLIAKINPLLFEAAVEQASANYASAKAALQSARAQADLAVKQLARLQALEKENLAAKQDVDSAQSNADVTTAQVQVAVAALAQAQAQLHQAETNLSFTNIVSPIDGTVISRSVDVGQTVAASLQAPTVFTIAEDLRKMQVNTNVSEGDIGRVEEGMVATFTVDAFPGQRFRGRVSQIRNSATTVQNVVTYDAVIDVDNADLRLRPGMTANVTIVYADRHDALAVPNAALRFRPPPESNVRAPPPAEGRGRSGDSRGGVEGGGHWANARPSDDGQHPRNGEWPHGHDGNQQPADAKTVWKLVGNEPVAVGATVGLSDGAFTEVTGGELSEGDRVVIDADVSGKAPAATSLAGPRRPF
ncbi:MAG: efflux RND transporter periplasmic adaptor subunit [Polyangiaceae bacterium]|jgi:HlyD family secretion protein